jgi:thiol-disulfide isomerase/thioredoxin
MITVRQYSLFVGLLFVACGCAPEASSEPPASESGSGPELTDVAVPESAPMARPAIAATEAATGDVASAAAGGGESTAAAAPDAAAPQEVTLELMEWDGVKAIIESHKGKVLVVDCWATYCVPCRREFPGLVKLSRELPEDVVCVSVSLDEAAEQGEALDFLKEQDAVFTNVLCTTDADTLYDQILKVGSIPAIFVYDRDGAIARTFTGANPDGGEYTYSEHIAPFVRDLAAQK